jgi:hypothetical protein
MQHTDSSTHRFTISRRAQIVVGVSALALAGALVVACGSDNTAPAAVAEIDGPSVTVAGGTAHTYVMKSDTGVTSLGIALDDKALAALPDTDAMWELPLPATAAVAPWDHAVLNWNAHGHPPLNIYGIPHFDFHFYDISTSTQMAIQGGPDMTPVAAQYVPADYESQVMAVPMMGVHWVDSLSAEYHGHTFDKTFIYGFSNGNLAFIEPMITLDYIRTHPSVSAPVKQPAAVQASGRYPASYSVRYDAAHQLTRVELDSLRTR